MNKITVKNGKFINVIEVGLSENLKFRRFEVLSKNHTTLGLIRWFGKQRKYVFCPFGEIILSEQELDEISSFLTESTLKQVRINDS